MKSEDLAEVFPVTMPDTEYLSQMRAQLAPLGFTPENTLPALATCRDELATPFAVKISDIWGSYFNFGGLGSLMTAGKTAFAAASIHAPTNFDRERYLFISMAHIGITADFEVGKYKRCGQDHLDNACAALVAFTNEVNSGTVDANVYGNDLEMGYLKRRLLKMLPAGKQYSLLKVTEAAHDATKADIEAFADEMLDPKTTDWAVYTGIQLHMPQGEFIAPRSASVMMNGEKQDLFATS